MQTTHLIRIAVVAACCRLYSGLPARAASTIDAVSCYAYGANFGWLNWLGNPTDGAVVGEYACSGNLYSANVGWISLGGGAPTNRIYYQNLSANDYGVNQDGLGNLTGYAYGANIGWITFEQTYGRPKVNLLTGQFSGSIWSANCGWISLSNAVALVQTDRIQQGALAPDGLPIAWLLTYFGTTNENPNADPTGKGMTLTQDYLAGTDPLIASSLLKITAATFGRGGTNVSLSWSSVPTRFYYAQKTLNLVSNTWTDSGLGLISSAGSLTSGSFTETNAPVRFYRVEAVRPLLP